MKIRVRFWPVVLAMASKRTGNFTTYRRQPIRYFHRDEVLLKGGVEKLNYRISLILLLKTHNLMVAKEYREKVFLHFIFDLPRKSQALVSHGGPPQAHKWPQRCQVCMGKALP